MLNFCEPAGIPVTASRRPLSCAMVHAGDMRRSEDEFSEVISRGTSAADIAADMVGSVVGRTWSRYYTGSGGWVDSGSGAVSDFVDG